MSESSKKLTTDCKRARKRQCKIVTRQVEAVLQVSASQTLEELIALRDIACANKDEWTEECLLLTQQVADYT